MKNNIRIYITLGVILWISVSKGAGWETGGVLGVLYLMIEFLALMIKELSETQRLVIRKIEALRFDLDQMSDNLDAEVRESLPATESESPGGDA